MMAHCLSRMASSDAEQSSCNGSGQNSDLSSEVKKLINEVILEFFNDEDCKGKNDLDRFLFQLIGLVNTYKTSELNLSIIFLDVIEEMSKKFDYWVNIRCIKPSTYDDKIPFPFRFFLTHYLYPLLKLDNGEYSRSSKFKVEDILYPHKSLKKNSIAQAWVNAYNFHQYSAKKRVKEKNSIGNTLSPEETKKVEEMKNFLKKFKSFM